MKTHEEYESQRADLEAGWLIEPTSWDPLPEDYVLAVASGQITRPEPALWTRDDGAFLLYPGRTHLFMGEPESCKTWVALEVMAQEIASGNAAVYVDIEDEIVTAVERLLQLGLTADEIAEGFIYLNPVQPFDDVARMHLQVRMQLCEHEHDRQVTLAVIDSMTEAMALESLDPDKGTQVTDYYHKAPLYLARSGLVVVIIDHMPKAKTKNSRWAIGSERKISGLTGAGFVFTSVKPFGRGRTGKIKVTISKDRPGSVRPLALNGKELGTITLWSDRDTGDVEIGFAAPEAESLADIARRDERSVSNMRRDTWGIISAQPGIGSTQLRDEVTGNNERKGAAREWLVANGYVREEKEGKTNHHYVVKPLEESVSL